jgi:hypothetical protein
MFDGVAENHLMKTIEAALLQPLFIGLGGVLKGDVKNKVTA